MKRIILAILAGLLLNVVLGSLVDHLMHTTGIYPPYGEPMFDHGKLALAFGYRALFMVLGGYVAVRIAKEKARKTVLILGGIGSTLWLAGAISLWDYAYPWYNISGVVLGIPITMLGYLIYSRNAKKWMPDHLADDA